MSNKKEILRLNLENHDLSMFLEDNFVLEQAFKENKDKKDVPKLQVSDSKEGNPSKGVDCVTEVINSDSENKSLSGTDNRRLIVLDSNSEEEDGGSPSEDEKSVTDVDESDKDGSLDSSNDNSDYERYDGSPIIDRKR